MKTTKVLYVFLIYSLIIIFSCKKKCGCDQDSVKTLHAHKAILTAKIEGNSVIIIDTSYSPYYGICNPEVIPQTLFDAAAADSSKKLKVIIDAEIKPACDKGMANSGESFYLNSIKKDTQ